MRFLKALARGFVQKDLSRIRTWVTEPIPNDVCSSQFTAFA